MIVPRHRSVLVNLILTLSSLLLTLAVIEIATRALDLWHIPDYASMNWFRPSDIDGVPYLLQPNLNRRWGLGRVVTNDDGLRADRPYSPKPEHTLRILALGDSITFGSGVDQGDTFPSQLQRLLNLESFQGEPVEVINAGVNGFDLADEAHYLPVLLERYQPQIIVWTLIPNDYDDSWGIDNSGFISWLTSDYVATSEASALQLGQDPTKPIDRQDFRRSMTPAALAWAEGRAVPPPNPIHEWFMNHLASYAWFAWVIGNLDQQESISPAGDDQLPVYNLWKAPDGRNYSFPAWTPLYSLRSRIHAYNKLLGEMRALAEKMRVPILLFNIGLPLQPENMIDGPFFHYADFSAFGEPLDEFWNKHNLRWDGHFNPEGNRLFAQAVLSALICKKLIVGGVDCAKFEAAQTIQNEYWRAFAVLQADYESHFLSQIDFENFSGFPQIVGGVFPPRTFPRATSHRAVFLLARPRNHWLYLKMKDLPSSGLRIHLRITAGDSVAAHDATMEPASPVLRLDLSEILERNPSVRLLEVELFCTARDCPQARLGYLGSAPAP